MARCSSKTGVTIALLMVAGVSACATSPRSEPVSTTTTSAGTYTPGGVELYLARQPDGQTCSMNAPPNIEFAQLSAELLPAEHVAIEKWARCLNDPKLQHATVVLLGGDDPRALPGLFVQRAQKIKEALIRYGVDARRVVIGASNATREGGAYASATGVRLEVTHAQGVRSYPPQDPPTRYGIRP